MWRPGYLGAEDEMGKNMYQTLITAASGISDSKYFLVIYGFGLGSLFYGLAFMQEANMAKWLGYALIFISVLSLSSFLRYYLGVSFLSPMVNWTYEWVYPYLQPAVRVGIGVWILKAYKR